MSRIQDIILKIKKYDFGRQGKNAQKFAMLLTFNIACILSPTVIVIVMFVLVFTFDFSGKRNGHFENMHFYLSK